MGLTWNTEMAFLDGRLISTIDAYELVKENGEQFLKGKLKHAMMPTLPVKFIHSDKKEDYFALVTDSNFDDRLRKLVKRLCKVHPLHSRASHIVANLEKFITDSTPIYLDSYSITIDRILNVFGDDERLYGISDDDGKYIIPDAIIETAECTYYLEFTNTHRIGNDKLLKYKYLKAHSDTPFKVLEIFIDDIIEESKKTCNLNYDEILVKRIVEDSEFKRVLDLGTSRADKDTEVHYWGRCTYCGTPLQLASNKTDEAYCPSVAKSKHIKIIHLSEKSVPAEDSISFGGALLYCPHCAVENRYKTLPCPDCLTLRGNYVALKLLYNPNKGAYLECPCRLSTRKKVHGEQIDDGLACDFSMTILDTSDNWDMELRNTRGFFNLFKIKEATRTRNRVKKLEHEVKMSKSYRR